MHPELGLPCREYTIQSTGSLAPLPNLSLISRISSSSRSLIKFSNGDDQLLRRSGFAAPASDLLRSSRSVANGVSLRSLAQSRLTAVVRWGNGSPPPGVVMAKIVKKGKTKQEYRWPDELELDPNVKGGVLSYLSHFKTLKEKPKPITLPFEKPLMDLKKKIMDCILE